MSTVSEQKSTGKPKRKRHTFNPRIKAELKTLCKLDNWHGPLEVAEDAVVIGIAIGITYLFDLLSLFWFVAYFLSLIIIGTRMRALAELLHQSAHGTLAQNKTLNYLLGTLASGYLVFQSWTPYRISHVINHHVDLGATNDPDTTYHREQGLYDPQSMGNFMWQYLIAPLFLLKTPSKLFDLFRHRFFSSSELRWERALKFSYIASLITFLVWTGFGVEVILFWVVPFATVFPVVNWFVELCEHYPYVLRHDVDVFMTRNRWTGFLTRFFLGIHSEHLHLTHHLDPRIPAWNLAKAHRVMMQDPTYRFAQLREVGFLWPIIPGIPSILGSIAISSDVGADGHGQADESVANGANVGVGA